MSSKLFNLDFRIGGSWDWSRALMEAFMTKDEHSWNDYLIQFRVLDLSMNLSQSNLLNLIIGMIKSDFTLCFISLDWIEHET